MYRLFLLPDVLLEQKPWAEVRRAVEGLLAKLKTQTLAPSPERLQVLRAMEVLEHIGSSEARDLLQRLAKGAAEAQLTQQAKASLQRLDKRAPASR